MRSSFPRVILFTLLAMVLQIAPIGKTPPWMPVEQSGDVVTVKITADGPVSPTVTITVGTAIQWYNTDDVSHTITSDTGAFTVTLPSQGDRQTTPFSSAGTFPYHVTNVSNPAGTIIVLGTSATPTDSPTASETSMATSTSLPSTTPTMTAAAPTATTTVPSETPTASPSATATPLPITAVPVTITADQGFVPSSITVTVGTAIQWTNERSSSVTVAVDQGAILVGPIGTGASATLTFTQTGLYTCTLVGLPGISGLVLVAPAPLTPSPSNSPTEMASALVTNTPPSATVTATAAPDASGTSTVGAPSVTDTAIPSPTATPSPTDNATGTPTVPLTTTPAPTSNATQTASATAEATASPMASPTPPLITISLVGDASVTCVPDVPVGAEARWSNDNGPSGPAYDLTGISPEIFTVFQAHLEPGHATTYTFTEQGLFTYSVSRSGNLLTTAVIPVGVEKPCPAPSVTPTELATLVGTLTPTSISASPTATASDMPTATTVSLSTPTAIPTATATSRPTSTLTATSTSTPIPTPASEPSSTPTATTTTQPPSFIPLQTPASSGAPPSPTAAKHTQAKPTVQIKTTTKRKQTVQPCWSALPREQVAMRVRGYLQHGPARVAISLDLQVSAQRFSVTLHWRDPRSRLDLTGLYFSRPRIICRGLRLQGTANLGKHRQVPFVLQMLGLLRGKTAPAPVLDLALSALHYRLHGVLRGQKPLAIHYSVPIPPPVHKKGHP